MYHSSKNKFRCMGCKTILNDQIGFSHFDMDEDKCYTCEKCGYVNDFSYDEVSEYQSEMQKNEERMDWYNIVDLFLD